MTRKSKYAGNGDIMIGDLLMKNPLFKEGFYAGFSRNQVVNDDWDEDLHPRDENGKFTSGGSSSGNERVTYNDPMAMKKLEAAINKSDINRVSKDNNKNNQRIRAFLEENYPDYSVKFWNDKTTGNVEVIGLEMKADKEAREAREAKEEKEEKEREEKCDRFYKQLKNFENREKLQNYIQKNLEKDGIDATVRRSHSAVNTMSFYVDTDQGTIKISDHYTIWQELQYSDLGWVDIRGCQNAKDVYSKVKDIIDNTSKE